jgi:DNA-binding MarR family transcriptional regulator
VSAFSIDIQNQQQLVQLSREVHRIAGTLARLSANPATPASPLEHDGVLPHVPVEKVRALIRARCQRKRYLPDALLAEPAWDMMLDLLEAELSDRQVSVSSLCIAAAVPASTALRTISVMVAKGLLNRRPDPLDGRRVYVELAPDLSASLRRYFAETFLPCAP